jgi:hypothetical protein
MQAEKSRYLQAGEKERAADRKGHPNGYKLKTVRTRMGEITFVDHKCEKVVFLSNSSGKGTEKRASTACRNDRDIYTGCLNQESKSHYRAMVQDRKGVKA